MDLASYPATKTGAQKMIEALKPRLISIWKQERASLNSDDLIVVINTSTADVRLDRRESIYTRIKRHSPDLDILPHFTRQPSKVNGTVKIWAMIGFPKGQICILPLVLAYS
jgi:hypothetical protein